MKIFGVDPGSHRTGYGCVESDGSRHRLVVCGVVPVPVHAPLPDRLLAIHRGLRALISKYRPDCVAIEDVFHARNVRSALLLGHARGVALLAAREASVPVATYTPAEIKHAVVGYGRAEKRQVQSMVRMLLGLSAPPSPHDVADALAAAICHLHSQVHGAPDLAPREARSAGAGGRASRHEPRSWRQYRPRQGKL